MRAHSNSELKELIERRFGSYLRVHGFEEGPSVAEPRVRSITYRSPDLELTFFSEGPQDVYAKVGPPGEPTNYFLGGTLAFLAGAQEPYLDVESLVSKLPQMHRELASLFAREAVAKREALDGWVSEFARKSTAAMQAKALEAKAKRKWWPFGT